MRNLRDKVALATGGAGGVGLATALALADAAFERIGRAVEEQRMRILRVCMLAIGLCFVLAPGDRARSEEAQGRAPTEVAPAAERTSPLAVGSRAPTPELRDVAGKAVSLGDFVGRYPTALVFFRGGW